ncbi:MAG: hypothetical protein HYS83_00730 [Candidatus Blackburnbacteria bacterium]|nr:hypothetical protein [Candidatus Blackburnbacteria bacterium]
MFSETVTATLRAGLITAQQVTSDTLQANEKLISPIVQTDQIRGATDSGNLVIDLSYEAMEQESYEATNSSIAQSPNSGFGKLLVKGNLEVTQDATISGTLTATRSTFGDLLADTASIKEELITNNLEVQNDATISGTTR